MEQERPTVEFRLLGEPQLRAGESVVEITSAKQRALLVALALHANSVVSGEQLIEALWGEDPPESASATVRGLVSRLRKALPTTGASGDACLRARGSGYVLEIAPDGVDVHRFERLAAAGRDCFARGDAASAAQQLRSALALWRGPALGGLASSPFTAPTARRLDEARLDAVEDLAEAELSLGRPGDALAHLESHVEAHPLRERAWASLMLALYRLGRQADALRVYQQVRRLLGEELGIEPNPALRDLEARILRQDPALSTTVATVDFPPLRAAKTVRHNLPAALTSFVGRVTELAEIAGLVGTSRLVTLVGPGGCGKTRLALEAAARQFEAFPDGAWLAELAPLRAPTLVSPEVATAVGLDLTALSGSGRPFTEALCDQLRHRRLLLVLDNCEHVIDAAADLAHQVLTRCPDVTVLATSREILGVPGEQVVNVGPLSLPPPGEDGEDQLAGSDAGALFCERARESAHGFAVTAANAAALVRICRRLDGLPLALELAAARMRLLGAAELAERLDDRFRLLSGGSRRATPRHQTLEAAFDWSYALLSEAERIALARLSVFTGTFDLAAAEAVVGGSPEIGGPAPFEVLDLLGRLADKSLLVSTRGDSGETRHRLLETVRQYAAGKLADAGETEAAHRRHRDHYVRQSVAFSTSVLGGRQFQWADSEQDNIRAALEWSRAHGDDGDIVCLVASQWMYWYAAGSLDGFAWLEHAVAKPGESEIALQVKAWMGLALLRDQCRRPGDAPSEPDPAATHLAVESGDPLSAAWARFVLAEQDGVAGRPAESEALLLEVVKAFRSAREPIAEGHAWSVLAWTAMARADYADASAQLERALLLVQHHPDNQFVLPHVLAQLALVRAAAGDADKAADLGRAAVAAARIFPGRVVLVMALVRAAQAVAIAGRPRAAPGYLDELLGILRDLGSPRFVAEAFELTAMFIAPDRAYASATLLGAASSLREAMGERGLGLLSHRLAECDTKLSQTLGRQAREDAASAGAAMHLAEVLGYARARLRELLEPR